MLPARPSASALSRSLARRRRNNGEESEAAVLYEGGAHEIGFIDWKAAGPRTSVEVRALTGYRELNIGPAF
jgi:hypothetical protein